MKPATSGPTRSPPRRPPPCWTSWPAGKRRCGPYGRPTVPPTRVEGRPGRQQTRGSLFLQSDYDCPSAPVSHRNNLLPGEFKGHLILLRRFLPMRRMRMLIALVSALAMVLMFSLGAAAHVFSDVEDDAPYADAFTLLNELKIFEGYGDGTVGPNDLLTREQFAAVVIRALGETE